MGNNKLAKFFYGGFDSFLDDEGFATNLWRDLGSKESQFYSLPFGQAVSSTYYPKSLLNCPEKIFVEQDCIQFFCNLNSPKNFTFPAGKLRTEFTSPVTQSTSRRLSDMNFFAHWDLK